MFIDVLKPEEDRTGAVILVWHDGTEGKENPIPFPIVSDPNCVTFGGGDSIFETEYNANGVADFTIRTTVHIDRSMEVMLLDPNDVSKSYTITTQLPEDATRIYVGLNGVETDPFAYIIEDAPPLYSTGTDIKH